MDLWIRNQDRCVLQKVKKIYVTTYSEEAGFGLYDINYDDLDDCDVPLGFYKTRERALEVLDEIQDKICQMQILFALIPTIKDLKDNEEKYGKMFRQFLTYEMPKE